MHDLAIIGGGLAGLSLSIEMARNGFDVVLIEKKSYPFHKVCGEYISNESKAYLNWLGVDLEALGARSIDQFQLTSPNGVKVESKLPLGGIGISRYTLDQALATIAENEGVKLMTSTTATEISGNHISTSSGDLEARAIAGAQGKRSSIDRTLNRSFMGRKLQGDDNYLGVKYHVKSDLPKDLIGLHMFNQGYLGISAVEGDAYCMCYLVKASALQKDESIAEMEDRLFQTNPVLHTIHQSVEHIWDAPETISQIYFEEKDKSTEQLIFSGDAAGLIAPLSGNGMSMAMHSSHLLAIRLTEHLRGKRTWDQAKTAFERDWNVAFKPRFRASQWLQQVFFRPVLMESLMKSANFFPPLKGVIIRQTHGRPFFKE